MPKTPTPAAGEAMPAAKINRRKMLTGTAGALAAAAPGVALAAPELPVDKVTRLGYELSDALAEYLNGKWHATVFPPSGAPDSLGDVRLSRFMPGERPYRQISDRLAKLAEMRTAVQEEIDNFDHDFELPATEDDRLFGDLCDRCNNIWWALVAYGPRNMAETRLKMEQVSLGVLYEHLEPRDGELLARSFTVEPGTFAEWRGERRLNVVYPEV